AGATAGGGGFGSAAFAGGWYGSGGGASAVVAVGGVNGGGVPLSARAGVTKHTAATAMTAATAGARALDEGMAASPCPQSARACPAVASCGAEARVKLGSAAAIRPRAAPRAHSRRRSNDLVPREPRMAPLPG